jgi:hypothetical protein
MLAGFVSRDAFATKRKDKFLSKVSTCRLGSLIERIASGCSAGVKEALKMRCA